MPPSFDWDDIEDIAIALTDKYPDIDPLTVRFTDMHKWITELPLFTGDPPPPTKPNSKPSRWPGTKNSKTAELTYDVQQPGD